MAAAFRSTSTANTGATPASSVVVNMPSGVQPNDNLFLSIACDGGSGSTITPPSGWTILASATESTDLRAVQYWRLADGTEPSSYTVTFDTTRNATVAIDAYSGASLFVPNFGSGGLIYSTGATSFASDNIQGQYTGMAIEFTASFNTTGTSSWTQPSGFTQHTNQSTSASSSNYIGLATSNYTSQTWQLSGAPSGLNFTNSQTVKAIFGVAFLQDYHFAVSQTVKTSLVVDQYTFAAINTGSGSGYNSTSLQFITHYPNELLLLAVSFGKDATHTVSSVTGGGLTWSLAARENSVAGDVEFWYALAPTPATVQPNVTFSGSVTGYDLIGVSIIGVDMTGSNGSGAVGATAGATASVAAPTVNLTTTRNGSLIFAFSSNSTNSTTFVTGTNQTLARTAGDATNNVAYGFWFYNTPIAASGTSVTMNATTPSTSVCDILAIEILPAITHGLGSAGAGT